MSQNDEFAMREAILDAFNDEITEYAIAKVSSPSLNDNQDFMAQYSYLQHLRNDIRHYRTDIPLTTLKQILNDARVERENATEDARNDG